MSSPIVEYHNVIDNFLKQYGYTVTREQLEAFICVHPDFGGMTCAQAAEHLGINVRSLKRRLAKMRAAFPACMNWAKRYRPDAKEYADVEPLQYTPAMDDLVIHKF